MRILFGAVLAALVGATAVQAEDAETTKDLRCIVAIGMMAGESEDPEFAVHAAMEFLYFLGRVEGREPGLDLEAAMRREADSLSVRRLQNEAVRCGKVMVSKGEELEKIGKSMQTLPDLKPDR